MNNFGDGYRRNPRSVPRVKISIFKKDVPLKGGPRYYLLPTASRCYKSLIMVKKQIGGIPRPPAVTL